MSQLKNRAKGLSPICKVETSVGTLIIYCIEKNNVGRTRVIFGVNIDGVEKMRQRVLYRDQRKGLYIHFPKAIYLSDVLPFE